MELLAIMVVAGTIGLLFFAWILEGFIFKNREPTERAALTVGFAFFAAVVLAAIRFSDLEPLGVLTGVIYVPGAILGFYWFRKRYTKRWAPDISEVFE